MSHLDHPLQLARLVLVGAVLCVGGLKLLIMRGRRDPVSACTAIWSLDIAVFVAARWVVSGTSSAAVALFAMRLECAAGMTMIPLAIQLAACRGRVQMPPVAIKAMVVVTGGLPWLGYLWSAPTLVARTDLLGLRYYRADRVILHAGLLLAMIVLLLVIVRRNLTAPAEGEVREHRAIFRLSLALLVPAGINDMLMQNGVWTTVPLLDLALALHVAALVWLVSEHVERLRGGLEQTVAERTAKLAQTLDGVRALLDMLPDTVLVYRRNLILYANRAGEALLGYDQGELEGKSLDELAAPEQRQALVGRLRRAARGTPTAFTADLVQRDGAHCVGDVVASFAHYDDRPAAVAVIRDASVRTRLEQKLRTADRLASIGRLASGVGHEINNPLTTVIANLYEASEAARDVDQPPAAAAELRQSLDEASRGADRVRGIVAHLRQLSRTDDKAEAAMSALDLRHVVSQTIQLARYETRHRAEIHTELDEVELVVGNARRLGQAVLNLLVNAAEAMDGHEPGRIDVRVRRDRDAVVLEVEDNGRGMSPETLARAADPFYTTKDVGEGTGLGLALCYGVAENHGGALAIQSEQGVGTLVRLTLPAASCRFDTGRIVRLITSERLSPLPAVEVAQPRRARVLIVDDEEALGNAFVRLLREHEAHFVTSGAAALAAWDDEPFDVILCDLMMPEMTGAELYAELCAREPNMRDRFIVVTGGAVTPESEQFLANSELEVLYKPVSPPRLREVVAEHVARIRSEAVGAA